jgi:hypothetical protein
MDIVFIEAGLANHGIDLIDASETLQETHLQY